MKEELALDMGTDRKPGQGFKEGNLTLRVTRELTAAKHARKEM